MFASRRPMTRPARWFRIHDIKPAARIVADIVAEAERLLDTLHA